MKILFVAMPFSVHTARWVSQLKEAGFDIHLFPSMEGYELHPLLENVTFHQNFYATKLQKRQGVKYKSPQLHFLSFINSAFIFRPIRVFMRMFNLELSQEEKLLKVIRDIRPDIIHTLETQHAGYLVGKVKSLNKEYFPRWIHSNWGIDLHFFGRLEKHMAAIRNTMEAIDVFTAEGQRDILLAEKFGFSGPSYKFPGGGGFEMGPAITLKPSLRKKILIKGTQDIVRRGLVALRAVERCSDILGGYEVVLYSSNEITQASAELIFANTGLIINIAPSLTHEKMLQLNSEARITICVNMSDGLPNAMLEGMLMGAFPIQSNTSTADEIIDNGKNGILVPPEDPDIIEQAIRKAIADDSMVDEAAIINRQLIQERLEYGFIKRNVIAMYQETSKNISSR